MLWRWSTIVQICSELMIALFFLFLAYSTRREEINAWVKAWLFNIAALAITVTFWLTQPESALIFRFLLGGYIFFKTTFVLLLVAGVQNFTEHSYAWLSFRTIILFALGAGLLGALTIPDIPWLGVVQASLIAFVLIMGTALIARSRSVVMVWLGVGFFARAIIALIEVYSYWMSANYTLEGFDEIIFFLAVHSSFDAAAEWWIALGCALALYQTIQNELTDTCKNLEQVTDELKELVDCDPLTGLGNRRNLRAVLDSAKTSGATIVFFDLDNFKQINDRYGHQVGDECLKFFANALSKCFRPVDHLFRYAGDEFIVVSSELKVDKTKEHLKKIQQHLEQRQSNLPRISFSVGYALLEAGAEPDMAIKKADAAMYLNKTQKLK